MVDHNYVKIPQKNRNLRKPTKMLIWIYLKGDIMDAFYGDGTEENRKILTTTSPIMS